MGPDDWNNAAGSRTARGIEFHEFADGLGLVLETGTGRASYSVPDQICLYLRDYLKGMEPALRGRSQVPKISFRDIDENSDAFRRNMDEIDERLRREGVPIPNRPILALRELALDGLQIVSPSSHSQRVFDWFDTRYGSKLKIDFSIGRSLVLVRGDPYVVRFPLILGAFDGVFDVTNIFEDLTKEQFAVLSDDERSALINLFVNQYEDFRYVELLPRELRSSLDAAVSRVVGTNPHLGESKWASLQFAEKVLKAFIDKKGERPGFTHELPKLAAHVERLGGPAVPEFLIRNIQCRPGVRYGDPKVTLPEAIGALHAAIKVGTIVAPAVTDREPVTTALR